MKGRPALGRHAPNGDNSPTGPSYYDVSQWVFQLYDEWYARLTITLEPPVKGLYQQVSAWTVLIEARYKDMDGDEQRIWARQSFGLRGESATLPGAMFRCLLQIEDKLEEVVAEAKRGAGLPPVPTSR